MSEATLNAEKREALTKGDTKALRRSGRVPAVYYMHGEEPVSFSIDAKDLKSVIHGNSSIIDLALDSKKKLKSVIRDIQWHPVTGYPLHVDFMGIKMTEKITVEVPIRLVGVPTGVKNSGGILQQQLREISVECLPGDIPEHLEVDVSDLDVGDSVHISTLNIDKVTILTDPEQSIATVSHPTIMKEPEEGEEEMVEPEVIGQEGEPEEGEEESESD